MKFKKFITIMQAAMGIVPLNKRELLPPGRKLWRPPGDQPGSDQTSTDLLKSSRKFCWSREAQYLYLRRLSSRSYSAIMMTVGFVLNVGQQNPSYVKGRQAGRCRERAAGGCAAVAMEEAVAHISLPQHRWR
ncbi:hypothetical protein INR49_023423 [Caranx melampygus]|nr:hypothetical protein INR49_023423 [Caranx melampygus]